MKDLALWQKQEWLGQCYNYSDVKELALRQNHYLFLFLGPWIHDSSSCSHFMLLFYGSTIFILVDSVYCSFILTPLYHWLVPLSGSLSVLFLKIRKITLCLHNIFYLDQFSYIKFKIWHLKNIHVVSLKFNKDSQIYLKYSLQCVFIKIGENYIF